MLSTNKDGKAEPEDDKGNNKAILGAPSSRIREQAGSRYPFHFLLSLPIVILQNSCASFVVVFRLPLRATIYIRMYGSSCCSLSLGSDHQQYDS